MRLSVENLPRQGRSFKLANDTEWAVAGAAIALDVSPLAITGEIRLVQENGGVRVTGQLDVSARIACARCGEGVAFSLHGAPDLVYRPVGENLETDAEIDEADLDVGWYEVGVDGGELSLEQVVCEAVALEVPPRIVCEDVAACDGRFASFKFEQAPPDAVENPFSVLKNLR